MHASLQDMKFFVAAYEERSFTAAAARVHATQSGMSQHIKQLEDGLGMQLFVRDKGRIRPSPAGDRYYRQCVEVLRAYEAAARSVRDFSTGLHGEVKVGLMPLTTRCTLAPALQRFVVEHPNVRLHVVEGFSAHLTQLVASQSLDFAVVPAFAERAAVRQRRIHRTQEVLVSAIGSLGLRQLAPVRMRDLPALKMVLPGRKNARRQMLDIYLRSNRAAVDRAVELDTMHGVLDFVSRTDWVTVLPSVMLMQLSDTSAFCLNPLADPQLWTDLVLIEPATQALTPESEAFAHVLQVETQRLDAAWEEEIARAGATQSAVA